MNLPVIYSYVRCPYAARARLTLIFAGINCELREVDLSSKPQAMLQLSPKGTVPVLQLPDGRIIDESLDVMEWAVNQEGGKYLMPDHAELQIKIKELIAALATEFGRHIFYYRFPHMPAAQGKDYHRAQCELFLQKLDGLLVGQDYFLGAEISLADLAVYAFVRSFSEIDLPSFENMPCTNTLRWFAAMSSDSRVRQGYALNPVWRDGDSPIYLMAV